MIRGRCALIGITLLQGAGFSAGMPINGSSTYQISTLDKGDAFFFFFFYNGHACRPKIRTLSQCAAYNYFEQKKLLMECVNMNPYRPDEDVSRINENVQADSGIWRLASGIWHLASSCREFDS
jgi:hypothetical protein